MRRPTAILTAVLTLAGSALAGSTTTVRYEVVNLGLTEEHSDVCPCFFGQALNNSGEAAGFFYGADGTLNAFAYADGVMTDISGIGPNTTAARGMNDLGWIVGWTDQFAPQHAFLYTGNQLIDLGTLGGTYSDGHDVNDAGQVVGSASTPFPEDDSHAMIWQNGQMTDLGTLGGPVSEAVAISEAGLIVGWSWNAAWDARAVYWNPDLSGPIELPSFDLPERFTNANAVNDTGQIVGQVQVDSVGGATTWHAALWENGEVYDLGLLPEAGIGTNEYLQIPHTSTGAYGINEAGVIVGMSSPHASEPELRFGPFVHRDGVMTNLNDLLLDGGWVVTNVHDINDDGVIVGSARTPDDNHSRAILLVPVEFTLGDIDLSGDVGVSDLLALLASWGPCPDVGLCAADLNDDHEVGVPDLLILLANWGS